MRRLQAFLLVPLLAASLPARAEKPTPPPAPAEQEATPSPDDVAAADAAFSEAKSLLADVEGIRFCFFSDADVVRHVLVQKIILAYEKRDAALAAAREQRDDDKASEVP